MNYIKIIQGWTYDTPKNHDACFEVLANAYLKEIDTIQHRVMNIRYNVKDNWIVGIFTLNDKPPGGKTTPKRI